MKLESICIYCGSSPGLLPDYMRVARETGALLASRGITVVYGGGNVGLMGAVADGAIEAGGRVIGVIPAMMVDKEVAHLGLTELHVVTSMHERKMKMAELSDAFVALPGGIGTLEEIFEASTWTQLGFHAKPCGFLNVEGFYNPLFSFLRDLVSQRFLKPGYMDSLFMETDMRVMLERMENFQGIVTDKWMDRA